MTMQFAKAQRRKANLRLALTGPSGSGKTYSALLLAKGIGGKIALIDTEQDSASLYAGMPGLPEFDSLSLRSPFAPERFIEAMRAAGSAGYETLIIDSITHEWSGVGGCLELVDSVARAKYKGNTWSAWSEITPRHRAFVDEILSSPMHIIATMRSKTETAQVEEHGRKKVVKLGMKAEQRDGIEYEYTVVLDIAHDGHFAIASKDRTRLFEGDPKPITEATGKMLLAWLESGAEAAPTDLPKDRPDPDAGKVTPSAGASTRVSAEREAIILELNRQIVDHLANDDAFEAYTVVETAGLDADEKVYLWSMLDSKQRSALKAQSRAEKREPADAAT